MRNAIKMNIAIVGHGVAGKAIRRFLEKDHPFRTKSITIFEPSLQKHKQAEDYLSSGIWAPGIKVLEQICNKKELHKSLEPLGESGYVSPSGDWLAKPSIPREPYLQFINNSKLNSLLELKPKNGTKIVTEMVHSPVEDISCDGQGRYFINDKYDVDVVLMAHGCSSK